MTSKTPLLKEPGSPLIAIEDEMRKSYLDYAMSVIVARALPDVRDGLKPVHRRILYAMKEGGYDSTKPYRKSARIVGDVMGKYHPHGDMAIYDSLVRMAQDFSLRLPLIDGQGNFGSMDGDNAAAMRYTEARLAKAGEAILEDYDKDTVDYVSNYDDSEREPSVLPSRVPNLLVNGAGGIAVGMATNIPPHNLGEVVDACMAFIDNSDITIEELMQIVPGPDFPTGGVILGRSAITSAYMTGNGSVRARARSHTEDLKGNREAIVIDDIPYQVNKSKILERIGELVRNKEIEGISEARDESNREGVRIVIELKKDVNADVMLNKLYKATQLQNNFPCNMLALVGGRPQVCTLRDFIQQFVQFREQVVTRRTAYELNKARERSHILIGLSVAVANIDEIIALIRNAKDPNAAREQLMEKEWKGAAIEPMLELIDDPTEALDEKKKTYKLSEVQARAILDLRLHRLTGLERDKVFDDLKEVVSDIQRYLSILSDRKVLLKVIKKELTEVKEKFATPRRTEILNSEDEVDIEDLIQREDMVVTISHSGYIKRVPLNVYRAQRRGGKGRNAMTTKEDDVVSDIFVASTHTPIVFFTTRGRAFSMKVWQLPLGNATSRGKAIVNLLPITQGETVGSYMRLPEDKKLSEQLDIVFATASGDVRRNRLTDFLDIRSSGIIAMKLELGDKLVGARICREGEDIMLATKNGKAIRFPVSDMRVFASRASTGVRGVKLAAKGDEVISLSVLRHEEATAEERQAYLKHAAKQRAAEGEDVPEGKTAKGEEEENVAEIKLSKARIAEMAEKEQFLLTVTSNGFGKRTSSYDYRITARGGQGVTNMNLTAKNGNAVATFPVTDSHQILLVTDGGQMIRIPVDNIRITSRNTQGVTLFKVGKDEKVVSVAWLAVEEEDEGPEEEPTLL